VGWVVLLLLNLKLCFADFSSLWPKRERHSMGADVLNGISVSSDPDILFMTGKNWDRMFRVK
jgi:glutamine cyclotransferase